MGQSCIRPIPGYKLEWITTSYLSSSLTVVLLPALADGEQRGIATMAGFPGPITCTIDAENIM